MADKKLTLRDRAPKTVERLNSAASELNQMLRTNGFSDLLDGVTGGVAAQGAPPINSLPWTLSSSNAYTPATLNRVALSYAYMSHGLVQTLVTQPVLDAFRGGVQIESPELSDEECSLINKEINRTRQHDRDRGLTRQTTKVSWQSAADVEHSDIAAVRSTRYWARLYGGAGLIVNTTQDFRMPLDPAKIQQGTPLEFIPADRWELILSTSNIWDERVQRPFNYYGLPLHRTRVVKSMGQEAPSYIRTRLQGWGMSELERAIRPINAFLKFENVVFELMDEAKLDIYKIDGFNASLLDAAGTAMTSLRLKQANQMKNVLNAVAMDTTDGYERKQMTFSGLAELWDQCRMNLCSALKIPMTKLFGMSSGGFGSGADSMENYNSTCANEREEAEPLLRTVIDLRCMQNFGYIPEYTLKWSPLRTLDGEQEQQVLTARQNRIMQLKDAGMINGVEASILLRREELLPIETEVSRGLVDAVPEQTQAAIIGNEGQLTHDKKAEKREDKPRYDKKAGDGKEKKT